MAHAARDTSGDRPKLKGKELHKGRPKAAAELPEPLRDSESDDEASPHDAASTRGGPMSVNMNQSIFGLIAAAGSRVDFNERFNDASSDDDDGTPDADDAGSKYPDAAPFVSFRDLSKTTIFARDDARTSQQGSSDTQRSRTARLSRHRLLKSLATLPRRKSSRPEQSLTSLPMSPSPLDTRHDASPEQTCSPSISRQSSRLAPVMGRMLQARAEMSSRPSFDLEPHSADLATVEETTAPSLLAHRLMEIFGFSQAEQVIEEYPCWLLQSVLLQGFLYITARHVCYYAYLPKKAFKVTKSGYLSKNGRRNPKYNRYWFRLKGDVLSYYRDPTNLYFPHGQIDLRFGISATLVDGDKDGLHFSVVTNHRTYNFRADGSPSAKEWVKCLQRVIFRSHNDGDSVKISLPIENIIDIEETQMMEFSETCKIRVFDNDETYAIDEYFFSFFSFGKEAISTLKCLVEDAATDTGVDNSNGDSGPLLADAGAGKDGPRTSRIREPVKATLSPVSPRSSNPSPRASCDVSSRTSLDALRQQERRSHEVSSPPDAPPNHSTNNSREPLACRERGDSNAQPSTEFSYSNLQSSTDDPSVSILTISITEEPSASQILRDSHVFHSPTIHGASPSLPSAHSHAPPVIVSPHEEATSGQAAHAAAAGRNDEQYLQSESADTRPVTPTALQNISKIGSYPLQRAGAFADYLNKTGKRMSSLLASESMGYVEKVSDMWKGGRKHYDAPVGLRPDEDELEEDAEGKVQTSMERFRAHFALPDGERLQATYFGYIVRVLPLYGKIYISDRSFCFRSLLPGTRTKLILPLKDIETAHKEKGFRFGYSGLVAVIRGHEELFFEFGQADVRDDCAITLLQGLETSRFMRESGLLQMEEHSKENETRAERDALQSARGKEFASHEALMPRQTMGLQNGPTILSDESDASVVDLKPRKPLKITCLTIGSRGDVQPYIALCKRLLADGHEPRIATHGEFQSWIESHGIEFARVEGDPGELMRLCIENGTFTLAFLREANSTFRGWLDDLLDSAWRACEGSELLIESPSAMAGIHIAEKLGIPYFRAFTMPWTRTRAYPHAFIMPEHKRGGAYNYMTYVMFDNIFWKATAHQVNRWRNKTLGLPNTSLEKMQPNKVPFLYNFSPNVVAPPLDFSDWIRVTGYWFLNEGGSYQPPKELADFIRTAREDGKKLVYVGFGSIIVNDPARMTQEVIDAVVNADVRCILSKGWSDRISPKEDPSKRRPDEPEMPPEIFVIKSAPHDWLFGQVDAAAHHGGSGTTGASLRAGVPTIIRPFFGDQYFFASRVEDLGVGVWVRRWSSKSFGRALWEVTRNERMITKARMLGEQIRKENGVNNAIQCIYRDLEYAKSLIKLKAGKNAVQQQLGPDGGGSDDEEEGTEESWTFVGADVPDPDVMTQKLSLGPGRVSGGGGGKALGSIAIKRDAGLNR
ncbi:hypothetical protein CDD82_5095 [Ophiocordyceps australis]|uniref:sterol 3beta-glucosyltransferase n=1 Tax=Ophiocordyceps australis TaxID=1399860 RepID=A0A2C5Z414_9HYPO|nr:hypothetical protein CDD82_5095 [Ophiocordyceps australis]